MTFEDSVECMRNLNEYKEYYKNGELHGVMGCVLSDRLRTVYSISRDNRFTVGMLRDLIRYKDDKTRDLCLITDETEAFAPLRTLLEERYDFTCSIMDDVLDGKPIMYSFYFNLRG